MLENAKITYYPDQATVTPNTEPDQTLDTALAAARAADDRKADNITVLRVSEVSYLADYFVIVTGFSPTQVRAIYQAIAHKIEEELHRPVFRVEGQSESNWIVMDYGDVIIHIMMPKEREFYNLEAFWSHSERVNWAA